MNQGLWAISHKEYMTVTIPIRNLYPPKQLSGYYCMSPFMTIHIQTNGTVSLCPCPGWGYTQIGNIIKTPLEEMLASELAQSIRQSIIDGSYRYCNEKQCAIIINQDLNTKDNLPPNILKLIEDSSKFDMPYEIMFNLDRTCNLSCPSCRTSVLKLSEEEQQQQKYTGETVFKNLFSNPTTNPIHLSTNGAGEVFGSPLVLDFLNRIRLENFPNFTFELHTNGLLSEKNWYQIRHLESVLTTLTISIDAARADTYEQVRRGGKWKDMLSTLTFLKNKKQELNFKFCARLIVQQKNYNEIIEFYNFCKEYNIDLVEYSRLTNWNTWSLSEFQTQDVLYSQHPEHDKALAMINLVKQLPDTWFEGNFE
jgi:MoaA/NifB/PqqE/SkfB family radical SAM enzyme